MVLPGAVAPDGAVNEDEKEWLAVSEEWGGVSPFAVPLRLLPVLPLDFFLERNVPRGAGRTAVPSVDPLLVTNREPPLLTGSLRVGPELVEWVVVEAPAEDPSWVRPPFWELKDSAIVRAGMGRLALEGHLCKEKVGNEEEECEEECEEEKQEEEEEEEKEKEEEEEEKEEKMTKQDKRWGEWDMGPLERRFDRSWGISSDLG